MSKTTATEPSKDVLGDKATEDAIKELEKTLSEQVGEKVSTETKIRYAELMLKLGSSEKKFDFWTLIFGLTVFLIYIVPPFNSGLRWTYQKGNSFFTTTVAVASTAANIVETTVDYIAPDLQKNPKVGDEIAGYPVTSGFGPRESPCAGCSDFHRGVDLGTPVGVPLYAIGEGQKKVKVECFEDTGGGGTVAKYDTEVGGKPYTFQLLHLSKCQSGEVAVGSRMALTGDTGIGTGAHLHFEWIDNGEKVNPETWQIWFALTGKMPDPILATGRDCTGFVGGECKPSDKGGK